MTLLNTTGNTFAIIDGQLWLNINAAANPASPVEPKKPGRRRGWKQYKSPGAPISMTMSAKKTQGYKPRKHLGPDAEEVIREEIRAGLGLRKCARNTKSQFPLITG